MRLLDRILKGGFVTDDSELSVEHVSNYEGAQLVVADNVVAYFYQNYGKNIVVDSLEFPNVMLPFESTFIDMRPRLRDGSLVFPEVFDEAGILMQMFKPQDFLSTMLSSFARIRPGDKGGVLYAQGASFILAARLFLHRVNGDVEHHMNLMVAVDAEGKIVTGERGWIDMILVGNKGMDEEGRRGVCTWFTANCFLPALLTLSFMHCRNVKVKEEIPPPKLSKKYERKTGKPLLRYHVLKIDHMKEVLEREGHASTGGLKKALHICRGHFATYGEDGKGLLFGKHAGTVWVPMHKRGSITKGAVVKDYDVK